MNTGAAKRREQKPEADPLAAFASESGGPELRAFPSESDPTPGAPKDPPDTDLAEQRLSTPRSGWAVFVRVAGAAAIGVALGLLYPTFLPSTPEPEPVPPTSTPSPPASATSPPVAAAPDSSQPLATATPPAVAPPVPSAAPPPSDAASARTSVPRPAPPANSDAASAPEAIVPPTESASPLVLGVIPPAVAEPIVPDSPAPPAPVVEAVEARAAAAPPIAPTTIPDADDRPRIRAILDAYTAAYERLDAVSAATLWPGVDTRALTRAFSTLSRQSVSFDRCEITINGARATAECDGAIEYVRRVGDSTPHSRTTSGAFAFDRAAGTWRISNVTAR